MEGILLKDEPTIVVDIREPPSLVDEIEQLGVTVVKQQLAVGDFLLGGNVVVERKTLNDFESSVFDGRLFRQITEMQQHYTKVLLLLEGVEFPSYLPVSAREGALMKLALRGVPVVYSKGLGETANLLAKLAIKQWEGKEHNYSLLRGRKPRNAKEQALFVISSLPNISEKRAELLLEHFGSLQRLFTASTKELMEVEGIGKKTAGNLHKLFINLFREDSMEE